eukprot:gene3902-13972_t
MLTQPEQPVDSVAVISPCSPQSPAFLTQARRPTPSKKRKLSEDPGGNLAKEAALSRFAGHAVEAVKVQGNVTPEMPVAAEPSTPLEDASESSLEAEDCSSEDSEAPSTCEERKQEGSSGSVFSPAYKASSWGQQHVCSKETAGANDDMGVDENKQPAQSHPQPHHHHHPSQPEVPEAAESDYDEDEDDADCLDFDPLAFIKSLPSLELCVPKFRNMLLPKQTRQCKRKTLVLDLDETLVHSSLEMVIAPDFSFPVHFNNQEHTIHVRQRPFLHEFMSRVSELFEIVVFTASQKIYAEKLLNIIDPKHKYIKHRIYRDSCVIVDGNYLKDLSVLGRDLANTLIVDNSPQAFGFQIDNGVPIESWYEDPTDRELSKLLPFLEGLVEVDDVRPLIAKKFRLRELIDGSI